MSHKTVRTAEENTADKAAQLAAAREEAKQLKTAREAREAAAAHVASVQGEALHANIEDLIGDIELPSWRRVLCGFVLGLTAAVGVGYGIGMIMAYALAGIATLTASAGLALFLSILVWIIGIYSSWKIGGWVGGKVFASVVLPDGLAARSMQSLSNAKNDAAGWFSNTRVVQGAKQFTGAHVKPA